MERKDTIKRYSLMVMMLALMFFFVNTEISQGADPYAEALEDWPAIEAAAKKEGKLVIYGFAQPDWDKRRVKLFNKLYPEIKVKKLAMRGSEARNRFDAEIGANKGLGDVSYQGVDAAFSMSENGMLLSFTPPNALEPDVPWTTHPLAYAKNAFVFYGTYYGIGVNRKLLAKNEYPRNYRDLLKPRWRGKFSLKEPRIPGSGNYFWYTLEKLYGKGFLRQLMDNKPKVKRSYWDQVKGLASGQEELMLIISKSETMKQQAKGAPIDWIAPEEGIMPIVILAVVSKVAPHPNAAKVWINFLLSKERHQMRAANKGAPWRSDVAAGSAYEDIAKLKPITVFSTEEWREVLPKKRKEAEALLKEYGL
ncbi:MAG: extracellular solute-binding protein [Deltaproteobacteria bacterium]|nr:extracellular solute-binding protein [Deltaproteobacteria bacterium]MBW2063795.1 extracellular solute-binding protein [Deltaproteobacteria bacterium]